MAENTGADGELAGHPGDFGCAYILDASPDGPAGPVYCGTPCRPDSPYCTAHHALCHLSHGSRAEARQLRAIEALAAAVGGRQGRPAWQPGQAWLRPLAAAGPPFLPPKCSPY